MTGQFTAEAEKAIHRAAKYAVRLGNTVLGTEHILYGLSAAPGVASRILKENKLDKDEISFEIENYCGIGTTVMSDWATQC